jgi:hypothetical protein
VLWQAIFLLDLGALGPRLTKSSVFFRQLSMSVLNNNTIGLHNVNSMFPKFLQRSTTRDASASPIAFVPSRTPVKNCFAWNDDANWWMVTLSDLALLLLGFLLVWHLLDKNNLNATKLPTISAEIGQKPKLPPSSDPDPH